MVEAPFLVDAMVLIVIDARESLNISRISLSVPGYFDPKLPA